MTRKGHWARTGPTSFLEGCLHFILGYLSKVMLLMQAEAGSIPQAHVLATKSYLFTEPLCLPRRLYNENPGSYSLSYRPTSCVTTRKGRKTPLKGVADTSLVPHIHSEGFAYLYRLIPWQSTQQKKYLPGGQNRCVTSSEKWRCLYLPCLPQRQV